MDDDQLLQIVNYGDWLLQKVTDDFRLWQIENNSDKKRHYGMSCIFVILKIDQFLLKGSGNPNKKRNLLKVVLEVDIESCVGDYAASRKALWSLGK